MREIRLLAIDDDPLALELVKGAVEQPGLRVSLCGNPQAALERARAERPQIAVVDLMMPGTSGIEVSRKLLEVDPSIDVVLLTSHYSTEAAIEAIRQGACDYIDKSQIGRLQNRVASLLEDWRRRWNVTRIDEEALRASQFQGIIGRSPAMLEVFARLRRIGPHFQTALVSGQTGTGKEMIAAALHRLSPVAHGPFVVCNCAAIPENLVESELFGHLKGSFTGAVSDKAGLFEAAHNGVLFLDELGELPMPAQAKLLRAIQQQEIQRVGATAAKHVNVRIVAATNRNLHVEVDRKRFREDLLFRLSMVEIKLPTLAERPDDIPLLIRHFIERFSAKYQRNFEGLTRRAEALLLRFPWPGNVRDLENAIGYACMMAETPRIDIMDLPERIRDGARAGNAEVPESTAPLVSLDEIQRMHARRVIEAVGGNKVRAASILGISRATLYRLIGSGSKSEEKDQQ